MNQRDLIQEPLCTAETLGRQLPDTIHAVSVSLPRWADVVGYEEKRPEVMARLAGGYPRFLVHPLVQTVAQRLGEGAPCLPFPSARAAERCAGFVRQATGLRPRIVAKGNLHAVVTTEQGLPALRAFWQHTGLIVSSRQAEDWLEDRAELAETEGIRRSLRSQLAGFYDCGVEDVFLAATGMAAVYAALQAIMSWRPGLATAQLGFPYVDTLKLQQKLGHGGHLLHNLDRLEPELHELLHRQPLGACFCEIPGNPLLGSANVSRLSPLLREHQVPLIADDVVATPYNVDLRRQADLIATSLTKYIVGAGNAMGGALICNPASPFYSALKPLVQARHEELLWGRDALLVDTQARSFPERMKQHNRSGLLIAQRLRQHPRVERVWYPQWEFCEAYEGVRRRDGGWGGLVTILPKNAETASPRIYDALHVCKGPSLGTCFTLACPFTLLAHYTELDWAESCGVSRYLIRLSIGLEDPEALWQRLDQALNG